MLRMRQRSTVPPSSYFFIEGRICGIGPVVWLEGFGGSACSTGCRTWSLACLLVSWLVTRCCSRESKLSEYVRAEAQDELCRGREKDRNVVKLYASLRVGANVKPILKEREGVYLQRVKKLQRAGYGENMFCRCLVLRRAMQPSADLVCLAHERIIWRISVLGFGFGVCAESSIFGISTKESLQGQWNNCDMAVEFEGDLVSRWYCDGSVKCDRTSHVRIPPFRLCLNTQMTKAMLVQCFAPLQI